jgi:LysM repeat protein
LNRKRIFELAIGAVLVICLIFAIGYYSGVRTSPTTTGYYVVKAGDTCRGISYEHNIPMETLIEQNGLAADCSNLLIGQKLILPAQK